MEKERETELYLQGYKVGYNDAESYHIETVEANDDPDYWTRLEHQYAGMAMQGICSSGEIMTRINKLTIKADKFGSVIAELSANLAHALVQKLKEKEERK